MARPQSIDLAAELKALLPKFWLRRTARELGVCRRRRKVDPAALVWTLILGFGAGSSRSLASLRRFFSVSTGVSLVASSFYKRFTRQVVELLQAALARVMAELNDMETQPRGCFSNFRDLVVPDGTVLRLHRFLAKRYPGSRTNHSPAAARLHLVLSVIGSGVQQVQLTSQRVDERSVLRIGDWVKGRLLIFDLGFYGFSLFDRIDRRGGYFLSRLKSNANLKIVGENRTSSPGALDLVGRRLEEVRCGLRRDTVDVEAEVVVVHRRYRGRRSRRHRRLRVVGIRHERTRRFHWYITNIPADDLPAEQVRTVYAARWEIELVFKELKSQIAIGELPSSKPHIVEALIYAAVLALLVSRRMWQAFRSRLPAGRRLSERRVTEMLRLLAPQFIRAVLGRGGSGAERRKWHTLILAESCDPNRNRRLNRDFAMY
jgi:IS4 transposase